MTKAKERDNYQRYPMKLIDLPVFFLDLQTTGAKPETSDILEMAWATPKENSLENFLVQIPDGYIPKHIRELTGLDDLDLQESLPLKDVFIKFQNFLKAQGLLCPAVIHYSRFEKPFLEDAFHQEGTAIPFDILCTHEIAKRLFPNLPSRGIKGLAGYYGYVKEDLKRSAGHVEATRFIWKELLKDLEVAGVTTYEDLRTWLSEAPKTKRTKYEYPLAKEKRLSLPDQPGVYRMISKSSEILYVGKATSLKDRVNSYFRGQKNRDPRKLEMLTQVWDLQVTAVDSPLEAALLETDEIKKHNPRYNINLKTGAREMVFYNFDFTSVQNQQDENHSIGPFSSIWALDSVIKLSQSLNRSSQDLQLNPLMFFDLLEENLLKEGYLLFCQRHTFDPFQFQSVRHILAVGLNWVRNLQDEDLLPENIEEVQDPTDELVLTAEDIADKFERHFLRAGQSYQRARKLTRLLNSVVEFEFKEGAPKKTLSFNRGILSQIRFSPISRMDWQDLEIDTYDRMSILYSELMRIPKQHRRINRF